LGKKDKSNFSLENRQPFTTYKQPVKSLSLNIISKKLPPVANSNVSLPKIQQELEDIASDMNGLQEILISQSNSPIGSVSKSQILKQMATVSQK
jgi:hypothetical protein